MDSSKCQTLTATPAEPGELPTELAIAIASPCLASTTRAATGRRGASASHSSGAARTRWVRSLSEPFTCRTTWEVGIIHVTNVTIPTPRRTWHPVNAFGYGPASETTDHYGTHSRPKIISKSVPIASGNLALDVETEGNDTNYCDCAQTHLHGSNRRPESCHSHGNSANDDRPDRAHCGTFKEAGGSRGSAQTKGIPIPEWISSDIAVEIRTASREADRVFGNEPLVNWGVVPRSVEVNARAVVFPARVLERVGAGRPAGRGVAEGFVSVLSLNGAGGIRQSDRAPERVR